jgi:predicted nucleotidyltransferase component of viral defense system
MALENFKDLVDLAMQQPGRSSMRPVVEKEILYYDIFYALDAAGLLKGLVFQGGTSLRLCRGSSRFSEDLDFAGGRDFTSDKMAAIKVCIEKHLGDRYGLVVEVKEPKEMAASPDYEGVKVDKWQVSVETAPQQKDMPRQRIKLEIANIPAYTSELVPLRLNYDFLLGYGTLLVSAESLDEIVADKVVAFAASVKNIRYRDIWDLAWLQQQGAKLVPTLVEKKVLDYRIKDYGQLLEDAIGRLPALVSGKPFKDQMTRFIDSETITRTLDQPEFVAYLLNTVGSLLTVMAEHLKNDPDNDAEPKFRM